MKRKIFLFFSLLLILSFSNIGQVYACSSNKYAPPLCEVYGKSKGVFVGKVVGITELKKENSNSDFKIDFQIQESFLGVASSARTSVLHFGGDIEYSGFELNKSYLVYAYKGDRGFSLISSQARTVMEAREDLEFLRNLSNVKPGAQVNGTIMEAVKSSLEENNIIPVPKLRLKIEGMDNKHTVYYVVTDEDGHYDIKGIRGGKYTISPAKPLTGYYFAPEVGNGEFEINDKGCITYNFTLKTSNKFVGKVIDAEGNPVAHTSVEIISINAKRPKGYGEEHTSTNPDGTFYAYNITPGLYTVSVNYSFPASDESPFPTTFYPGVYDKSQAAVIEVKAGEDITDFEFRLPPRLSQRFIKGSVIWADGTPASGILVFLKDTSNNFYCINCSGVKTDEQGNFTHIGYEKQTYQVWASANNTYLNKNEIYGVSSSFSAEDVKPQTIVLNMTREQLEKSLEGKKDKNPKVPY